MRRESDIIANQEAKVADLRKKADEAVRAADMEEAVLRGMRLVAHSDVKPALLDRATIDVARQHWVAGRRGRQPGAISHEWRDALNLLYIRNPGGFSIDHVIAAAHSNNLPNVRSREAEERMRAYIELGYIERHGELYRVSELVAKKYGFARRQTTEAPTAVAEGAS